MTSPSSPSASESVTLIDRKTGAPVRETVLGDRWLRLACQSAVAPILRPLLFRSALPTRLLGWFANSPWSRRKIAPTIRELGIKMEDFVVPEGGYRSFNEFFFRRLRPGARPFDPSPDTVSSPADSRLLVYPRVQADTCFPVKGVPFRISELLGPTPEARAAAAQLHDGVLMVFRLCPADYHRFHFPVGGRAAATWVVPGGYESVNPLPLALGARPFARNWRQVTLLENPRIPGRAAFVEVGAFGVGAVFQTHAAPEFAKMDEKGYFAFGGSTVVLVFPRDAILPDDDLVCNSRDGFETLVRAGETIGRLAGA